jgi:hypothetical protein
MTATSARIFSAIAEGAAEATAAASAAVLAQLGEELRVIAVAGAADPERVPGSSVTPGDSLGFALASGQTLSVGPQLGEPPEHGGVHRAPAATLTVPCLGTEGVLGAIELRAPAGAGTFPPEASRTAALFAEIAAAVLGEGGAHGSSAPTPAELGAELSGLADADPVRYEAIAAAVGALLAHG